MTRIHILSPGFTTPNGCAFLFPLVVWRRELAERGLSCKIFNSIGSDLLDCDVLLVDSKFHRDRWQNDASAALDDFSNFAARCRTIYCDTSDSSGFLQSDVLPIVHGYAKAQLLKDRQRYLMPMYAHRLYADYYHRTFGVEDAHPEWSKQIVDRDFLKKLRLSWNSGLADYSLYGPTRMALYNRIPLSALLRFPDQFVASIVPRPQDISCRFGTGHPRASIAIQRRLIRERVGNRFDTRKVSRRRYFDELASSKIVLSPFGYGEITLKDFEVFLTGGLLIKPDLEHMETWPDLFRAEETIVSHAWDLSDFEQVLERTLADYESLRLLAETGQAAYRRHTSGSGAAELFSEQLKSVIAA